MGITTESDLAGSGRLSVRLFKSLRTRIKSGEYEPGEYLPGQRQLAAEYQLAQNTIRSALRRLNEAGLIVAEPRRGFRVLARAVDPQRGLPIAYVTFGTNPLEDGSDSFSHTLLGEFRKIARQRAWSLLVVEAAGMQPGQVMEQLGSNSVCGAVLDGWKEGLAPLVKSIGLPVAVVDTLLEDPELGVVIQDGFMGGSQAGAYLAGRGYERVAWIGPKVERSDPQIAERLGGAMAGLARGGFDLTKLTRFEAPLGRPEEALRRAREMLAGSGRPQAVIALWQEVAIAVAQASRELGLTPGKDLELVGWCTEEQYRAGFLREWVGDCPQPLVTWSIAEMAAQVVAQLVHRRADPKLPASQVKICTRLRLPAP